MQRSKIKNKTLFVAALSVYFGLLIVGAPPQILAQTALPQLVRQEIENDGEPESLTPKDDDYNALLKSDYSRYFVEFVENLQKEAKVRGFQNNQYFSLEHTKVHPCSADEWRGGYNFTVQDDSSVWTYSSLLVLTRSHDFGRLADCLFTEEVKSGRGETVTLKVRNNADGLMFEVIVTKSSARNADFLADNLNQVFPVKAAENDSEIPKLIYENTTAHAEKDQVFIVTRLPRAGLDSLLKADEKAK